MARKPTPTTKDDAPPAPPAPETSPESGPATGPVVRFIPLEDLVPYARNARTHDDSQVAQLAGSIAEFGFTNPVLADAAGIVAGHGRVLAARMLYAQGKTLKLPGGIDVPRGTVPVLDCTGWPDAKRRAYILADNRLALNAGWDTEVLAVELDALRDDGFDLSLIGFARDELNELIGTPNAPPLDGAGLTDETRHIVLVECANETAQRALFEELQGRGLSVKVMA